MDPIQPNQITQTQSQSSQTADSTFSADLAKEDVLGDEAFDNNSRVATAHRRVNMYRSLWAVFAIGLLLLLGSALYFSLRATKPSLVGSNASNFANTSISLGGFTSSNIQNAGELTINGSANIVSDINVGGNANIGGTLSATNLQGNGTGITNIQPTNIAGIIGSAQLDPYIAYTNKNFQAFTGIAQTFRNSSDTTDALQVENAVASPVLSIDTVNMAVAINEPAVTQLPSGIFPGLNFEVNGNGRFSDTLQVGLTTPGALVFNSGPLFNIKDVSRGLQVTLDANSNPSPTGIYAGTANEVFVDPNQDAVNLVCQYGMSITPYVKGCPGGGFIRPLPKPIGVDCRENPVDPYCRTNIYAGYYAATQTASDSAKNIFVITGNVNAVTHAGTGTVVLQAGQINTIANLGTGVVANAFGTLTIPVTVPVGYIPGVTPLGTIVNYSGNTIVDPQNETLSLFGYTDPIWAPGTIANQVGMDIEWQHSGFVGSANIVSEGYNSKNYFEGALSIGSCANNLTGSSIIETLGCSTYTAPYGVPIPAGNKLSINTSTPSSASAHINTAVASDIGLVVRGVTAQTSDLTQWQDSNGLVLSRVDASGNFGMPTNGAINSNGNSLTINAGGASNTTNMVATISIVNPGNDYNVGDIITLAAPPGGVEARAYVAAVAAAPGSPGPVAFAVLIASGAGYTTGTKTTTVQTIYNTGTVSQSGNVVTGSGTTFTNTMVGSNLVYSDGTYGGQIVGYYGPNTIAVTTSRTVASQGFTIAGTSQGAGLTLSVDSLTASSNKDGGALVLKSGVSTGTGTSGIQFWSTPAGVSGSSNNSPVQQATITGSGDMGIGTASPAFKLDVLSSGADSTTVAQFKNAGSQSCTVQPGGSGFACSSDSRLKTNILSIDGANASDVVSKLQGVSFNWKTDPSGQAQAGFVAQDLQKLIPSAVSQDSNGYLVANYSAVIPYLVEAFKQQQTQIDGLKSSSVIGVDVLKTLASAKAVAFGGDITVNGSIVIKGNISGGVNSRGKLTVSAGNTQTSQNFTSAFDSQPYVQVTPLSQIDGSYWVSGSTTTGFSVQLEKPQAQQVDFNWFVLN